MRTRLLLLVFFFVLAGQSAFADKNAASISETKAETGSEKTENQKQEAKTPQSTSSSQQLVMGVDSTATTVKFNYLFYLIYKLKYGEEPPAELIDTDI